VTRPEPFQLAVSQDRRIPALGDPATDLQEWGNVARSPQTTFVLHPPVDLELAYRVDRFVLFLPFSSATTEMSVGEAPMRRTRLRAGTVMMVEPGTLVRVRQLEPVEFLVLAVDAAHVAHVAERAAAGRLWHTRTVLDLADPAVAALGAEIRRALLGDPLVEPGYLQLLVDAILARLTCLFLGEAAAPAAGEALSPGVLSRLVRHIEGHLDAELRVEDLARLAGLSRSHFSRAFQRMTGEAPQRFILKRRLCRARDLISAGAPNLARVAVEAGFSSQAHMTTAFRKELGVTPSRYREAFRPGGEIGAAAPEPHRSRPPVPQVGPRSEPSARSR
jgi:AraC family transcriptional regulator